jgi:hypothetical protein
LELAVMRMYFSMLLNVRRPWMTPSSSTIRFFSSRMMSAASLAMSTALSTLMPMSAARSAGIVDAVAEEADHLALCAARAPGAPCSGVSRANTVVVQRPRQRAVIHALDLRAGQDPRPAPPGRRRGRSPVRCRR